MPKTTEYSVVAPVAADTVVGNASGVTSLFTVTGLKSAMNLANVENIALSTWAGSTNIASVGTIGAGTWQGNPIASAYISDLAVVTAKLQDAAVTAAKLADNAVGTAKIADAAVTLAKLANLAQGQLIGRSVAGSGAPEAITIGEGLSLASGVLSAVGGGGGGGVFTVGSGGSAPELAAAFGTAWSTTGTTPPTVDTLGVHFNGASNIASALCTADTKNDTQYDVTFTIANYVGGSVRVNISGETNGNSATGTDRSGNGTYTERLTVAPSAGTTNNIIRIQATGSSGSNTFDITAISVREVGAGSFPQRAMNTKVAEIEVSVIDYGADKTGVADSTAAFVAAIGSGAKRLHIPAGTYKVTSLLIDESICIYGDGRGISVIEITGSGNIHGMRIRGDAALGRNNWIVLSDFTMKYVGTGQTAAGSGPGANNWSGMYVQRKCWVERVDVEDFTNDGIYFAPYDEEQNSVPGTIGEAVFFARFDSVRARGNGRDGFAIRRGANANTFVNCLGDKNGRYGIHHYTDGFSTYGNNFRDGQASYNGYYGYYFASGTNITTSGLYAEYNNSPDHTNTNGYTNTALDTTLRQVDIYCGDAIVRSWIGIGVLLNASTAHVRLPGFNSNVIQVWECGKKLFGDT